MSFPFVVEKDVTTRKFESKVFFVKRKGALKSYRILVNVHSVRLCTLRYPVGTISPNMHKCIHAHSLHVHSRVHQIVDACAAHTVHLWRIFLLLSVFMCRTSSHGLVSCCTSTYRVFVVREHMLVCVLHTESLMRL